jgi:2,5-diketo-D-gluconate reductase A
MQNVKLCNGVEMPMEGFGVFQVPENECKEVVLNAIRIGYRLIDTASSYKNEEAVGAAIRAAEKEGIAKRNELFIATKAYIQEMGYENLKEAFLRSLQKLGLDYLDLYLIHMPLGDYYGAWRAIEELYKEGKIRAIGVCNFDAARLMDLCYNAEIKPMVNQIERHPHYQRHEELAIMDKLGVQPQGWAPFAEGLKGMFTEPVLNEIAAKHGKTAAQVILRWNVQQGVIIIPKSVHKNRMEENLGIWAFDLDDEDMVQITSLDKGTPSMLDCTKPSEIDRLYNYLNNPVLTSLS